MRKRIRPRIVLIVMLLVGAVLIYLSSVFSFPAKESQIVSDERCSPSAQNRLQESYELSLRRKLASTGTQKQVLLNAVRQQSEFSDCIKVVDRVVVLAKQLVPHDTSVIEKADIVFALLHGLENNQANYPLTDTERSNALNLAELYLQFIKDSDFADYQNQLYRYKDLTLMLSMALENAGQTQAAQIWKSESQKHATGANGL